MVYVLNVVVLGDIDILLVKKGMCTIVGTVIILKLNMVQIWSGNMGTLIDNLSRLEEIEETENVFLYFFCPFYFFSNVLQI